MGILRFKLAHGDLARVRFAFSPLWECVASIQALQDSARSALHLPWFRATREHLKKLDSRLAFAAIKPHGYIPDFLTPPPTTPFPDFESELEMVRQTPAHIVRREVRKAYQDQVMPEAAQAFLEHPKAAVLELTDWLEVYWERTLLEHWPRIRALLEQDVALRARDLALGGAERLFTDFHAHVRYIPNRRRGGVLEKSGSYHEGTVLPRGRGLVLVPSAFVWPKVMTLIDPPWQPMLIYPARGVANLWQPALEPNDALEALLGPGCSQVLANLQTPASTLELAGRLRVAPSGVSHHLSRLRHAGLVQSYRQGHSVYYGLSRIGEGILGLYSMS